MSKIKYFKTTNKKYKNRLTQFFWIFLQLRWEKIKESIMTRNLVFISIIFANQVFADCVGPPSSPIVKIDIESCKLSEHYDNTLKVTGEAHQILSVYWRGAKDSGGIKIIRENKKMSDKIFWLSAEHKCKAIINSKKTLWLYDDVCNDTGKNIPSVQLQDLRHDIHIKAVKAYEMPDGKAPDE